MAEAKKFGLTSPPSPAHKDGSGKECKCLINKNHHRNSKNEECTCKIGFDHNTKSSLHKDSDGKRCNGSVSFVVPSDIIEHAAKGSAAAIYSTYRKCGWCQREERYHDSKLTVIFKKDVSVLAAAEFLAGFKPKGIVIISDKKQSLIEKGGMVAVTLSVVDEKNTKIAPPRAVFHELIKVFEEYADIVWAASMVMEVSFAVSRELPMKVEKPAKEECPKGDEEFPNEMSGV